MACFFFYPGSDIKAEVDFEIRQGSILGTFIYIVYANVLYSAIRDAPRSFCSNICHPDELQYPNSIYIKQMLIYFHLLMIVHLLLPSLAIKLQILMDTAYERFEANYLALNQSFIS